MCNELTTNLKNIRCLCGQIIRQYADTVSLFIKPSHILFYYRLEGVLPRFLHHLYTHKSKHAYLKRQN